MAWGAPIKFLNCACSLLSPTNCVPPSFSAGPWLPSPGSAEPIWFVCASSHYSPGAARRAASFSPAGGKGLVAVVTGRGVWLERVSSQAGKGRGTAAARGHDWHSVRLAESGSEALADRGWVQGSGVPLLWGLGEGRRPLPHWFPAGSSNRREESYYFFSSLSQKQSVSFLWKPSPTSLRVGEAPKCMIFWICSEALRSPSCCFWYFALPQPWKTGVWVDTSACPLSAAREDFKKNE